MITLDAHPEIRATEQQEHPTHATCQRCQRSFRPKSADQLSLELCQSCVDALRNPGKHLHFVRVKVRPRRSTRA